MKLRWEERVAIYDPRATRGTQKRLRSTAHSRASRVQQ